MPGMIRPYSHSPVQCAVLCIAGPFQRQGTGWNLSGDLPMPNWLVVGLLVIVLWLLPLGACISTASDNYSDAHLCHGR